MGGADGSRLQRFSLVSSMLLEVDEVPRALADVYLRMVDERWPGWPIDDIATAFEALASRSPDERESLVVQLLRSDTRWEAVATSILEVWLCGQLAFDDGSMVAAPSEAYLGAMVWGLIDAHAPGVPGPFFGEWAYPPSPTVSWVAVASPGTSRTHPVGR